MAKDNLNSLDREMTLAPVLKTTNGSTWVCGGVDTKGFDALSFEVSVGAAADTLGSSMKWEFTIEKSTTSNFASDTDLDGSELFDGNGALASGASKIWCTIDANGEASEVYSVGVVIDADFRYYRVKCTATGNHATGMIFGVIAHRSGGVQPDSTQLTTPA